MKRLLLALGLASLSLSWALADSLGDAARREEERRKKVEEKGGAPSHVISQEELAANKGRTSTDGAGGAAVSSPSTSAPRSPGSARGKSPQADSSMWAARAAALEAEVQAAEHELDAAKSIPAVYDARFAYDPRYRIRTDPGEAKVRAAQARLDAARLAREAFEDDARRQSIPPGWLRGQPGPAADPGPEARVQATDEPLWRQRMAAARAEVESAQWEYDSTMKQGVVPRIGGVATDTAEGMERYRAALERIQKNQESAKARLAAVQQALADLEEEARRSGTPPGWLR
jgi:hypothetical protein